MRLRTVQAALDALTGARFLRGVFDQVLIGDLKQLTGYFTDSSVRSAARERLAARITPETRVIVAHSLGSVIAYETLCDQKFSTGWDIHTLVTLGSPLGMGALVLDRLQPEPVARRAAWPLPLRSWTNIADITDVVATVRDLRPFFGSRVTNLTVHNGAHMHDSTRYLTAVETGQAIVAGLDRGDGNDQCAI
jgi:alpha-beta hydrolase superfamily lysophospholipase